MCKEQTLVFHSSTESENISLDTGLRLDGLPVLELWDLIVSVFGNVSRVSDRSGKPDNDVHKRHKTQKKINVKENIDSVPSNVQSANREALLYVFEDNEAVIKMIMKGRSPTMRHVSRTHRVALDWLFDRINLDSKIQIKYIDTKNQLGKNGRCSQIIENSKIGVSRHLDSSTTTQMAQIMVEDPVVPLERNLYGHPLAGLLRERQFEKILLKHGWEKIPNWECLFVHREKGLFLFVYMYALKLFWNVYTWHVLADLIFYGQ